MGSDRSRWQWSWGAWRWHRRRPWWPWSLCRDD
jgi:hypothetical protein